MIGRARNAREESKRDKLLQAVDQLVNVISSDYRLPIH